MIEKSHLILVTGGTGEVGPNVVKAFYDLGHPIRTLSLDPPRVRTWPDDVETLMGDVTDESIVQAAMKGVDTVVHLASLLHVVNPPPALREEYKRVNVGGTATVVEAAAQAGANRILFFSTIAVYGQATGNVLNEESPPRPDTFYGQTKLAAERIVLDARKPDGQPLGTVLRFGAIYGAGMKGNYRRLVQSLARGRFIPIGDGRNRRTLVYDKDVAEAVVLAVNHPAAAGKIYNVSDGHFHTMREIIGAICEALDRNPPRLSLPIGLVRCAAGILEGAGRMIGHVSPVGRATIDKYTEDIAVSSQRIQAELGFKPQYDLKKGWRDAIRDMRHMGYLQG